jgi:hypothetical protein
MYMSVHSETVHLCPELTVCITVGSCLHEADIVKDILLKEVVTYEHSKVIKFTGHD